MHLYVHKDAPQALKDSLKAPEWDDGKLPEHSSIDPGLIRGDAVVIYNYKSMGERLNSMEGKRDIQSDVLLLHVKAAYDKRTIKAVKALAQIANNTDLENVSLTWQ